MNTIKVGSKTAAAAAALVKYVIDSNIPSLTPKRWQISNGKTHHLSSIKNVKILRLKVEIVLGFDPF